MEFLRESPEPCFTLFKSVLSRLADVDLLGEKLDRRFEFEGAFFNKFQKVFPVVFQFLLCFFEFRDVPDYPYNSYGTAAVVGHY